MKYFAKFKVALTKEQFTWLEEYKSGKSPFVVLSNRPNSIYIEPFNGTEYWEDDKEEYRTMLKEFCSLFQLPEPLLEDG